MQLTGNTVLVTGGGSGIGRGLAESLFKLGNQVIIAGRRQDVLDNTTKANPGIVSLNADVSDPEAIQDLAARVTKEHPSLNVLINNAGIMRTENLQALPAGLADSEAVDHHKPARPHPANRSVAAAPPEADPRRRYQRFLRLGVRASPGHPDL